MEDTIIISKKWHEKLKRDSEFLRCLRECGVDNWDGYSEACRMMDEEEDE